MHEQFCMISAFNFEVTLSGKSMSFSADSRHDMFIHKCDCIFCASVYHMCVINEKIKSAFLRKRTQVAKQRFKCSNTFGCENYVHVYNFFQDSVVAGWISFLKLFKTFVKHF